jgi:hypothetical protein
MISWRTGPVVPVVLFLFCCALYAINLDKAPHFDELYHVLAARGYLATGDFAIAEGVYNRAKPFTWLVAQLFALLGDYLWVARLPSLVSTALLATVLFVWLRREAGNLAAVIGAGLFAVSPFAIDIAEFARFYGIHGLAFGAGALLVYDLLTRELTPRSLLLRGLGAIFAFLVAVIFQVTTFIGIAGLAVWAVLYLCAPWFLREDVPPARRLGVLAAIVAVGLVLAVLALGTDQLAGALAQYRKTPLWSEGNANDVAYYHVWLILYYPTLWTLLPVLFLVGLAVRARPCFFAAVLFATAIILHSFAGAKDLRYIFYAMPFLFVIWGIALAAVLAQLVRFVRIQADRVLVRLLPERPVAGLVTVAVAVCALWLVAANAASVRSALMLADITIPPERPAPRWEEARPILEPLMAEADVVVVTSELEALYFLGTYDVLISRSRMGEGAAASRGGVNEEFFRDPRTGRPVISTPQSVERLMACHERGIIITSTYRWRHAPMLSDEVADLIVQHAAPVELPPRSQVMAFTWDRPVADPTSPCPDLDRQTASPPTS